MSNKISLTSFVTFNDGVSMPLFGLGISGLKSGSAAEEVILFALKNGYRLLDTAQIYKNEADVGRAVKRSGIPRNEICVVSKVWDANHGFNKTIESVEHSLLLMQLDYIDVFLIHSPGNGLNVETYKALLDLKERGLIKSVGVSNFGIHHLKGLEETGLPTPSVNQIEFHPFCKREKLVNYCREKNIAVMGYCPLVRGKRFGDPDIKDIAERCQKTEAQVMIRWSLEKGIITIPRSSNPERVQENSKVFDFELIKEDHELIDMKPDNFIVIWDPTVSPWVG